jgi:hypothetical protein
MNTRATCINKDCAAFGIEKSVIIGKLAGFGAPNDRVICPLCGKLMRTTQTVNTSTKLTGKRLRIPSRETSQTKLRKRKPAGRKSGGQRKSSRSGKRI